MDKTPIEEKIIRMYTEKGFPIQTVFNLIKPEATERMVKETIHKYCVIRPKKPFTYQG